MRLCRLYLLKYIYQVWCGAYSVKAFQSLLLNKRSTPHFLFYNNAFSGLVGKQKLTKMKKILLFSLIALLVSCVDYIDDINAIDERLDALEQSVPSIDEQIAAIQTSIKALKEVDESLDESIKDLEANDEATAEEIAALKDADKVIEDKIEELKKYVDEVLKSTKDWVSATFATLEQLNALAGEVAALKSLVDTNKTENAISALETSLKAWVGEQLSNYYTIAEIDAKIAELQKAITDGDSALQQRLNDLKSQLKTAKAELTEAYKKAIKEAIETNNGVIDQKIASEIAAVNKRIDEEVAAIEARLDNVETQVKDLLARIQSVSYIPTYDDGKATVKYADKISRVTLDFEVSPKDAVAELTKVWQSAVSVKAIYTQTRTISFIDMPIVKFEADATKGVISVTASGENLSAEFFNGTQSASARLSISDGNSSVTSEYVPMAAKAVSLNEVGVVSTNEIWYTSTDGTIIRPYRTDVFGANIVSNTYEKGIGIIEFDSNVTSIGGYAFYNCSSLTSVIIPDSVTSIGGYAFYNCSSLTSVIIPDSVTSIGYEAFRVCTSLTSVTIGNSVTSIGEYAFYKCSSLTSVTIPDSVTSIGENAFSNCSSLTSVTIGNSVTSIGISAFSGCSSLTSVTISDSVTSIGSSAFSGCSSLTSVTIGNSVTSIGEDAFNRCISLEEVYCKPTTPPAGYSYMFDNNALGRKIYVPAESVEAYKSAAYWKFYADYIKPYNF